MGFPLLQGIFILLLFYWMNASQLGPQEEMINAFDCLGTVIRNYRDFPSSTRCSFDIDENCPETEIICHTTKKECRYTYRVFNTNVSLYIQFPKLKFIQATKILVLDCYCKEYIFNCTINSQVLRSIVHKDAFLTSTLSSSSLETTEAVTTMTLITNKPYTTDSSQTINPVMLGDQSNQDSETPYLAIMGALLGGIVLGAGVEYLLIFLLRRNRHSKNKKTKENITEMSKCNPAYSVSGESTKDPMRPDKKYYTQKVDSKNVYQNVTHGTADIYEQKKNKQEDPGQSIYNHLHEKKEIEDTGDHYDHAHRVPFELTATEKDYQTLKMQPRANTYTEVIADETEHSRYRSGEENGHYFVLDDKRS
uniref:ZP domain-containing protein n=1 Tax=Magallana gigas TaxID=29159 RepID=A0A8W8LXT8_MAGGI